jgi:hypothetical protein
LPGMLHDVAGGWPDDFSIAMLHYVAPGCVGGNFW